MPGRNSNSESNVEHGYEAKFVPELDKKYVCPICLAALRTPVQTKCGHRFCQSCLQRTCTGFRYTKCPVDNTWFDVHREIFTDNATSREVLSLKIMCENHAQGCEWIGELREKETHVKTCPMVEIKCKHKCGKTVKRGELEEHLKECPQRPQTCQHCSKEVPHAEVAKHQLLVCGQFPVNCVVCGEPGILRDDIPNHVDLLSGDCPLVVVKCVYQYVGCHFQDKRRNMDNHYRSSVQHHMALMSAKIAQQEETLTAQKETVTTMSDKVDSLCKIVSSQEKIIERQQSLLQQQLEATEELKTMSFDGKLLWKLQLPSSGSQGQVRSPSFYTGRPGYKISVMLELSGHQEGGESFTSFFLNLEKGRFDSQLCFPFSAVCSVAVIKQGDRGSRSKETSMEDCSAVMSCSQIPACPDANSSVSSQKGRLKFFKTEKLMKYAKNGVLFIQVDCTHGVSAASPAQQTPVKSGKRETETA